MSKSKAQERIEFLERELLYVARELASERATYLHAIKAYRAATNKGVKEVRDILDVLRPEKINLPSLAERIDELERRLFRLEP